MMDLADTKISGDRLVDALNALSVHFLSGGTGALHQISSEALIQGLAESDESRIRLAIIPLLLHHPELSIIVARVAPVVSPDARLYLQCFYTAACLFQEQYSESLKAYFGTQQRLPDLFSAELGVSLSGSPDNRLNALAKRHAELSGRPINWLGTYNHAAKRVLKRLRHEQPLVRRDVSPIESNELSVILRPNQLIDHHLALPFAGILHPILRAAFSQ